MPPQVVQSRSGCAETQPEVLYSSLDAAALRRLEAQEDGTHLVPCVHHIGAVVPAHHWHSVPAHAMHSSFIWRGGLPDRDAKPSHAGAAGCLSAAAAGSAGASPALNTLPALLLPGTGEFNSLRRHAIQGARTCSRWRSPRCPAQSCRGASCAWAGRGGTLVECGCARRTPRIWSDT